MKLLTFFPLLLATEWIEGAQAGIQFPMLSSKPAKLASSSMLKLHKTLIEFDSLSGNEANLVEWLVLYLQMKNYTVERQLVQPAPGLRENILAYMGKERNTRTIVSSHVDTVPPFIPYDRRGDVVWGRGSVDAKACVATQLTAVEALIAEDKLHEGDIGLLFVVDEEVDGIGMKKANDLGLEPKTVIFGEPTELKLASGHKGLINVKLVARGVAGHSGYPWLGRNANSLLIAALNALQNIDFPHSETFGNTTVNIGKIQGGVAANVIAEYAQANVAIRIAKGNPDKIKKLISDAVRQAGNDIEVSFRQGFGPVKIDADVEGTVIAFAQSLLY